MLVEKLITFMGAWVSHIPKDLPFKVTSKLMLDLSKLMIIICWIGSVIFYALTASINIPTWHLDGAFQTASGLYRLDAGQIPGRDFYPYLGIGPLYIIYPFFVASGANISASVFSALLIVLIVGMLSISFIWHLIWRPKSYLTPIVIGTILFSAYYGTLVVNKYFSLAMPEWIVWSTTPWNSLRPIRAIAPYLSAAIFYFYVLKINVERTKYIFAGVLSGSILLWSNDFAVPTSGLLSILVLGHALSKNECNLRNIAVYILLTIFSYLILIFLVTRGHLLELMRYNFIDVAQDQWWFFGTYGESRRIFSLNQLPRLFDKDNHIPLLVLACTAVCALRTRRIEHILILWTGAVLFSDGVVASVGGHLGGYFAGFYFWGMTTIIVGFARVLWLGFGRISSGKWQTPVISILILLGVLMFFSILIKQYSQYSSALSNARNDSNRFFVAELGGYLNKEWNGYVALAREMKEESVFEEYWGLWSAIRRTFADWPVDSTIHALGYTREIASQKLQQADMIISTRYSTSPKWQPWNVSQNYWFYEQILKDWYIFQLSPTTIIWRPSKHSRSFNAVECQFNRISQSLDLQTLTPGFYELDIKYQVTGGSRLLLMVKNNYNFGSDANGFVSINPQATQIKFPVYSKRSGLVNLDIKVIGNKEAKVEVMSCTAAYLPFNNQEVLHLPP